MGSAHTGPASNASGERVIAELADTILAYVATRPNACDTVDGICEWWIPTQRIVQARVDVVAALKLLESRGQIDVRAGADGQVLYRARSAH